MCILAAVSPSAQDIGLWVIIVIYAIPAVKVLKDWAQPPRIHPQPLAVALEKEFATKKELERLESDLNAQMKDMRAYVHDEIHKLRDALQSNWIAAEEQREGMHDRISSVVKVLYEMRGTLTEITNNTRQRKA